MNILLEAHSGIRWLVLLGLIAAAVVGFARSRQESSPDDKWLTWLGILFDIQAAIGVILYFANQGWDQGGFISIIHPIGMVAAVAAYHLGLGRGRKTGGGAGWRTIAIGSLVSLVLVIAAIPWQRM